MPLSEFDSPYPGDPGQPYYRPQERISEKIRKFYTADGALGLTAAAFAIGAAFLMYMLFSRWYGYVLNNFAVINRLYFNSDYARLLIEMLYSMCCVGMPFVIVALVAGRTRVLKSDIPFGKVRKNSHTFFLILGGIAVCFAGNIVTNMIISFFSMFGIEFSSFNNAVSDTAVLPQNMLHFLLMVAHTAIFPALFEEFAFRGVIMHFLKKYGDWFSVIVSAVFFGLIHGNMTQVPFAIIAGVALGYIVTVTGSLWPGVILHFCNNFISLIISLIRAAYPEWVSVVFSAVTVYGLILVGGFAIAYFISVRPCFYRLYPGRVRSISKGRCFAVLMLTPSVLVAFILMLVPIFQDMIY